MNKRRKDDFYATPGWVTRAILPVLRQGGYLESGKTILEPCAGDGAIIRELGMNGVWVGSISSFEIDKKRATKSGSVCADFLKTEHHLFPFDLVITNPPFSLSFEFAKRCYEHVREGGAMVFLLRLNWLASQKRASWLRAHTPSVYVLPKRPSFTGKGTDSTDYAWMVWRKPHGERVKVPTVEILEVE